MTWPCVVSSSLETLGIIARGCYSLSVIVSFFLSHNLNALFIRSLIFDRFGNHYLLSISKFNKPRPNLENKSKFGNNNQAIVLPCRCISPMDLSGPVFLFFISCRHFLPIHRHYRSTETDVFIYRL